MAERRGTRLILWFSVESSESFHLARRVHFHCSRAHVKFSIINIENDSRITTQIIGSERVMGNVSMTSRVDNIEDPAVQSERVRTEHAVFVLCTPDMSHD